MYGAYSIYVMYIPVFVVSGPSTWIIGGMPHYAFFSNALRHWQMVPAPAPSRASLGSNASTAPELDPSDDEEEDDQESDSSCLETKGN